MSDASDLAARVRAGTALRRLGHGLVGHEVDVDLLAGIADQVEGWLPAVEGAQPRSRSIDSMKRDAWAQPMDGDSVGTFPDCVVSGDANPMGAGVKFQREGEEAVCRTVLGSAFEGAPNRVHGGMVAAVFDDLMGFVLHIIATPAYTGELTVRYLAPTPVRTELEFRARLRERDGRKLFIDAEASAGGAVVATASGLFVAIDPARFAQT
jgi:acyl-coenzyme A thioesterase PaaI-like protein